MLFDNGTIADRIAGDVSVNDLIKYVRGAATSRVKRESTDNVLELTGVDFNKATSTGISLIAFYAPFSKYTAGLLETLQNLSTYFINNSNITIAKVDCSKGINKDICFFEVQNGVPSANLYNGTRLIVDYNGLTYDELKDLLFSHSHPKGKFKLAP